ncbi:TraR/DksA family transcriptional regulator [Variovorax sp. M-6]|uniref:TraR/DksA family transcriptional regulator n=1 Tax=Variovorax sp. M-6 TaxID=3233041 RepID=UPI003F971534
MTPLTESDREALALQLDLLKRRVLDELRGAGAHVGPGTRAGDHEVHSHADDAEAEQLDDVHFAEIEVDRTRLYDIERAQQRLADGLYGICADCGEEIPRERLLAQPTAIRCAACQTAAESRRRS